MFSGETAAFQPSPGNRVRMFPFQLLSWIRIPPKPHLVAEGGQVGGRFLPDGPDLSGWDQSEDVLDGGGGVGPELIPESIL